MVTFGAFLNLTTAYWQSLAENPDSDRQAAVKAATESIGGELLFFGYIHGSHDALLIAKTDSHADFLALLWSAIGKGLISNTHTFPVVDQSVFTDAFVKSEHVKYSGPGE